MRTIETEIEIDAPPSVVWEVITDLESYADWNPFIPKATGEVRVGERLLIRVEPPGSFGGTFRPRVKGVEPERRLVWLGRLGLPHLFDGRHALVLEPLDGERTRFLQRETFGGLAARETLAAMIAGFVLLFSRPFRVGDWIAVDMDDEENRSGIVTDVTIFNTKIQTFSDEYVLIPNDEITSSQLKNLSRNDQLRVEVEVGVDYTADIEHARDVMVDAVSDLESIKSSPNPKAVAKRFGDSSIVLELRIWIGDPTMRRKWRAQTDAIEAIKAAFDREGITIPYPQRVHAPRDGEEGFRVDANGPEPVDPPETDD
jgi:hypothetical protein